MKYNFDEHINRYNSDCVKWDKLAAVYGDNVNEDTLALWVADMDFATPEVILRAVVKRMEHPVLGYGFPGEDFHNTAVNWIKRRYNWQIEKEWISFTPGVVPALNLAVLVASEPGDSIISLTPVYTPFKAVAENNGRKFLECDLDLDENLYAEINFEKLENMIDETCKILMLCTPHNPCGRVWTKEELQKLGELAVRHDLLIVADEIHADFIYSDYKHHSIASLDDKFREHSITCYAPSKTFNMAGLGASVIVIPNAELKAKFDEEKSKLRYNGNIFAYPALVAAWSEAEDWLDELIQYLEANRDYLYTELSQDKYLLKPNKPEGTYLLWLDCRELKKAKGLEDDNALCEYFIKEGGLAFNRGIAYGGAAEGFVRLNYACPRATIEEAVRRLEKIATK